MDEHESNAEPNTPGTFELTRRTVIETGATALLLTTLPRAALAAGPVDENEPPRLLWTSNFKSTATRIL
jgi:xanthine dehydrogenase YagT iron-sulfur-binding subunit